MNEKLKIILVDDNEVFLKGLSSYIKKNKSIEIVAEFSSGTDLLEHVKNQSVDIVLLDIEMPGLNGIETAKRLNYMDPRMKLIAITMYQDKVYLRQLIGAGFKGFVSKSKVPEDLFKTIRDVNNDDFSFPGGMSI